MNKILEAQKKEFMSKKEQKLKKRLIELLRDDGKGHRYPKFAKRLEAFDVNIVYLSDDPSFTAAISFDEGKIYISEGFLQNEELFYQLNVLMRHELAHNLMMHQIRMLNKFKKEIADDPEYSKHISNSRSLHELVNWLEDFEISNKRYTDEDKKIVRNMILNGKLIGGLVTEEHRGAWKDATLEEMYDAWSEELEKLERQVRYNASWSDKADFGWNTEKDGLTQASKTLFYYVNRKLDDYNYINISSTLDKTIDAFINNQALFHFFPFDTESKPCIVLFKGLPDTWQEVVKNAYKLFSDNTKLTVQEAKKYIDKINDSSPKEEVAFTDPVTGEFLFKIYVPEEKLLVGDMIRFYLSIDYYTAEDEKWYKRTMKALDDFKYSDEDLKKILKAIDINEVE